MQMALKQLIGHFYSAVLRQPALRAVTCYFEIVLYFFSFSFSFLSTPVSLPAAAITLFCWNQLLASIGLHFNLKFTSRTLGCRIIVAGSCALSICAMDSMVKKKEKSLEKEEGKLEEVVTVIEGSDLQC